MIRLLLERRFSERFLVAEGFLVRSSFVDGLACVDWDSPSILPHFHEVFKLTSSVDNLIIDRDDLLKQLQELPWAIFDSGE